MYKRILLIKILLGCIAAIGYAQPQRLATWPVGVPLSYLGFMDDGTYVVDTTGLWQPYRHSDTPVFAPDSANHIAFQCNGNLVSNKAGQIMDEGTYLTDTSFYTNYYQTGNTITQSMVVLPRKGNAYWLFYYSFSDSLWLSGTGSPDRLYYAVVDMDANGGAGKVVQKKVPVYKGIMGDCRLTAVKHANGRDWWLVNHGYKNDAYHKFLVTPDTIMGPFIQQIGVVDKEPDIYGVGQFSQDGSKYASSSISNPINLMDFDRCTGLFSNARVIRAYSESPWDSSTTNSAANALCFSPNGRYLYVTSLKYLLQYDTWADTVENTRTLIAKVDSTYKNSSPFFTMFITPHNKIIIANYQGFPLFCNYHTIEAPDSGGLACNFQKESLHIPSSYSNYTLPNIVNLQLGAMTGSACDTIQTGIAKLSNEVAISIYPNPANSIVTIDYGYLAWAKGDATLEVYNLAGQLQHSQALPRYSALQKLSIQAWPSGMYQAVIKQAGAITAKGRWVKGLD